MTKLLHILQEHNNLYVTVFQFGQWYKGIVRSVDEDYTTLSVNDGTEMLMLPSDSIVAIQVPR